MQQRYEVGAFLRLDRNSPEYKQLTAIVKKRDRALYYIYSFYMEFDLPKQGAEVHHIVRRGSGGPDLESNMIALPYEVHRFRIHGLEKDPELEDRIQAYMSSQEIQRWRADHRPMLLEFYQKADDARLKRLGKRYRIKKKPGWRF